SKSTSGANLLKACLAGEVTPRWCDLSIRPLISQNDNRFWRHFLEQMTRRLSQILVLGGIAMALNACSTMTDLMTSNLPERHTGRASILVSLRAQEAYLYRGSNRSA